MFKSVKHWVVRANSIASSIFLVLHRKCITILFHGRIKLFIMVLTRKMKTDYTRVISLREHLKRYSCPCIATQSKRGKKTAQRKPTSQVALPRESARIRVIRFPTGKIFREFEDYVPWRERFLLRMSNYTSFASLLRQKRKGPQNLTH